MPSARHPSVVPALSGLTFAGLAAVVLGAAAGCADAPASPGLDSSPFEPPPHYATLWREVERCSGRTGDPGRVRWMRTDSFPGQPLRLAQWEPGHVITLRADMEVALPIVAHEILHDLLGGDGEHADPAWLECALPVAGAAGGRPPGHRNRREAPEVSPTEGPL
jgi:hypothetical protein